jgi:hypothetical protein
MFATLQPIPDRFHTLVARISEFSWGVKPRGPGGPYLGDRLRTALAANLLGQALPALIDHGEGQSLIVCGADGLDVVSPTTRTSPEVAPFVAAEDPAAVVKEMQQVTSSHSPGRIRVAVIGIVGCHEGDCGCGQIKAPLNVGDNSGRLSRVQRPLKKIARNLR